MNYDEVLKFSRFSLDNRDTLWHSPMFVSDLAKTDSIWHLMRENTYNSVFVVFFSWKLEKKLVKMQRYEN